MDLEVSRALPVAAVNGQADGDKVDKVSPVKRRKDSDAGGVPKSAAVNGQATAALATVLHQSRRAVRNDNVVDVLPQSVEDDGFASRATHMKYELRDTPGLGEVYLITMCDY